MLVPPERHAIPSHLHLLCHQNKQNESSIRKTWCNHFFDGARGFELLLRVCEGLTGFERDSSINPSEMNEHAFFHSLFLVFLFPPSFETNDTLNTVSLVHPQENKLNALPPKGRTEIIYSQGMSFFPWLQMPFLVLSHNPLGTVKPFNLFRFNSDSIKVFLFFFLKRTRMRGGLPSRSKRR